MRRLRGPTEGSAAIEFAVVAPVLLLLMAGVVEFGRIYQVNNACNRLATQYAMAWADCSDLPVGTCSTEMTNLTSANAIQNMVPQLTYAKLSISMFELSVSGSTVTTVYASSGATLSPAQKTAATAVIGSGQTGVVVTVSYTHNLAFFSNLMGSFLNSFLAPSYTVVQLKS